ncbi:hypothetical protein BKA81DRAFT_374497 [Phyllosticta paracitricarpa]
MQDATCDMQPQQQLCTHRARRWLSVVGRMKRTLSLVNLKLGPPAPPHPVRKSAAGQADRRAPIAARRQS